MKGEEITPEQYQQVLETIKRLESDGKVPSWFDINSSSFCFSFTDDKGKTHQGPHVKYKDISEEPREKGNFY
ncbi:MAG: hypothetical protein V4708_17545 [Bacteroidota bacterium]